MKFSMTGQVKGLTNWTASTHGLIGIDFTNKADRHDITEILLKVALSKNKQY